MVIGPGSRRSYHWRTSGEKHTASAGSTFRRLALLAALTVALAALSAPWTNIPADNADGAGMLAHLHGLFEGRDLLYDDEYAALNMSPLFAFVTGGSGGQGVVSNHWPFGASFLQAPGWLLGRLAGVLLVGEGISEHAAAWAIPRLGLRCWALLVLAWLLTRIHLWLGARGCGRWVRGLTVIALLLGTPLLYYAGEAPMRPHLWGAAVVAILVMRWFDAIDPPAGTDPLPSDRSGGGSLTQATILALLAGLAAAIRPQLAPLCLLVAHERVLATAALPGRRRVATLAWHGLVTAGAWALWPLAILRLQLWIYGDLGDYSSQAALTMHLRAFLLSTHHGALVWCPVLVLGLLGLAIGAASRQRGALLLLLLVAMQIWLDAGTREIEPFTVLGTRTWTGGTAFGPRKLVDALPLLLPGVIWIERWLATQESTREQVRWRRRLAVVAVLALIPTTLLLGAAWIDPQVTSVILDGERLLLAMSLALDPGAWAEAFVQRALPVRVGLAVGACVGLPLAAALLASRPWIARVVAVPPDPRRERIALAVVLALPVAAQLWLSLLLARSEAILAADPGRMAEAAARMNPWHEATVAAIPSHHRLLRARLGDDAVD